MAQIYGLGPIKKFLKDAYYLTSSKERNSGDLRQMSSAVDHVAGMLDALFKDIDRRLLVVENVQSASPTVSVSPTLSGTDLEGHFIHIANGLVTSLAGPTLALEPNGFVKKVLGTKATLAMPGELIEFVAAANYSSTAGDYGFVTHGGCVTNVMPEGTSGSVPLVAFYDVSITRPAVSGRKGAGILLLGHALVT